MGDFADDLRDHDNTNDFDSSPVMCTGCGEVVREDQTRFENGKSCCVFCK
jgi:formylmethanofuran dehydrogenase subunit E